MLKKYVLALVDEKLKEIGIKTRKNDSEEVIRLRANLMGLDYFAEDEERFRKLADMYETDATKMDPEIREDILSVKIYLEPTSVEEYLEKYKTTVDPDIKFDYLMTVALVREKEQLEKVLALLGDVDTVKPQDQLYLYIYLYRNPRSRKQAFEWLTENWDYVKKMVGDKSLDAYPRYMANLIRTEEEFVSWREFFEPMRDDPALARAIKIGENEIQARLKLIQKHQAEVWAALEPWSK